MSVDYIALQGCIHGDVDLCYNTLRNIQEQENINIVCLLWSGDVQTTRHEQDLQSMACPPKYRKLKDFHKYYNGIAKAPCLTLFVGGNHEASEFLLDIYFGGWVAPNIYYFGKSGVVWINGVRVCGLSGIYNQRDIRRGYFETSPLNASAIRSVYHVRQFEIEKMLRLSGSVDMILTHDWPVGIVKEGQDRQRLLRKKPFFRQELESDTLGNPFTSTLLNALTPCYWVAAHLHVNFHCAITEDSYTTRFLCHNKPGRTVSTSLVSIEDKQCQFDVTSRLTNNTLSNERREEVEDRTNSQPSDVRFEVDAEWLWILRCSNCQIPKGDTICAQEIEMPLSPSFRELKELAVHIDQIIGCNWMEVIARSYPEVSSSDKNSDGRIVPREFLRSLRFQIPDWTVLDFRDPRSQTIWWRKLIAPNDRTLETSADWKENDEEECLSI